MNLLLERKRSENICCICLDHSLNPEVLSLCCGTVFHYKCLENWTKRKVCCPYCLRHFELLQNNQTSFGDWSESDGIVTVTPIVRL